MQEKDTPGTRKLFVADKEAWKKSKPVKKTRDERFLPIKKDKLASLTRMGRQPEALRDEKLLSLRTKAKGGSAEASFAKEKDAQDFAFEWNLKSPHKYRDGSAKDTPIDPHRVLKEPNYLYKTLREKAKNRLRSTENGM